LQSHMYSLLATPLVTGMVGYCTNWLAIKMLFRPHKKSLLSFGWQGVIPKNRSKLASEIGVLVGDKLLRQDDIQSAFFSESVQEKLEKAVEQELQSFLEKDFGTLADILGKTGMSPRVVISALLEGVNQDGLLTDALSGVKEKISESIFAMKIGELEQYSENISDMVKAVMATGRIQSEAVNSISSSINNFVMSGKSMADIIPDGLLAKTPQLSAFITEKILDSLDKAMSDETTRKKISRKLTDIKDNHFSDGAVDQMKLGFLNMFMNEDSIAELVDQYLPTLVRSIKESDEVKGQISGSIDDYINGIVKKPLFMHADTIGLESLFQLRSSVVTAAQKTLDSGEFSGKISGMINELIKNNSEKTLGDILHELGLKDALTEKLGSGASFDIHSVSGYLADMAEKFRIKDIYSVIPKKLFYSVKMALLAEINKVVEKNTPKMLEAINFPKITEDRINSLDLYEVENLLFSFMKDSFRWINILGFILGFLFGAVQSGIIFLLG